MVCVSIGIVMDNYVCELIMLMHGLDLLWDDKGRSEKQTNYDNGREHGLYQEKSRGNRL